MPRILINGDSHDFNGNTLAQLLAQLQPDAPFAAAVNTVFVPRGDYAQTRLAEGDKVDIVAPVGGG